MIERGDLGHYAVCTQTKGSTMGMNQRKLLGYFANSVFYCVKHAAKRPDVTASPDCCAALEAEKPCNLTYAQQKAVYHRWCIDCYPNGYRPWQT